MQLVSRSIHGLFQQTQFVKRRGAVEFCFGVEKNVVRSICIFNTLTSIVDKLLVEFSALKYFRINKMTYSSGGGSCPVLARKVSRKCRGLITPRLCVHKMERNLIRRQQLRIKHATAPRVLCNHLLKNHLAQTAID